MQTEYVEEACVRFYTFLKADTFKVYLQYFYILLFFTSNWCRSCSGDFRGYIKSSDTSSIGGNNCSKKKQLWPLID